MLRIFRRLRQKLISEQRMSKYLLYAIGEILLVVIGILIALQVNNWNEVRKLRNKNSENLFSLSQELKSNKEVIGVNIEKVRNQIRTGLNMMDSLNTGVVPRHQWDAYLLDKVGSLGPLRLQPLTTTTLDEMINTGSYSTIVSDSIKNHVLAYNGKLENVAATLKRFDDNFHSIELPYLTKHFSIIDMLTNRNEEINKADIILLGEGIPSFKRETFYFSHDYDAFINNREFASICTNRYFDLRDVMISTNQLNKLIEELLVIIEREGHSKTEN